MKRTRIGDVVAVSTASGIGFVQYIGRIPNRLDVVLVDGKIHAPGTDWSAADFDSGYFIGYPLPHAVREGLVQIIGDAPAPSIPTTWRRPGRITNAGIVENWIVDGPNGFYVTRSLTDVEARIPIELILSHDALLRHIELCWRPEHATDSLAIRGRESKDIRDSQDRSKSTIRYYVYFQERDAAESFAERCRTGGYEAHTKPGVEDVAWTVTVLNSAALDDVQQVLENDERFIERALDGHGGFYDGHEVSV